jgi:hypothetical protein
MDPAVVSREGNREMHRQSDRLPCYPLWALLQAFLPGIDVKFFFATKKIAQKTICKRIQNIQCRTSLAASGDAEYCN